MAALRQTTFYFVIFYACMSNQNTNIPKSSAWKGRLLKFIVYVIVGFLVAFLYRQMKN